jgi:hypothetical protein
VIPRGSLRNVQVLKSRAWNQIELALGS